MKPRTAVSARICRRQLEDLQITAAWSNESQSDDKSQGGEAEVLTDWRGEISDAQPLADARLVAMVATDEPTEEDKRRRADRDDAFV